MGLKSKELSTFLIKKKKGVALMSTWGINEGNNVIENGFW